MTMTPEDREQHLQDRAQLAAESGALRGAVCLRRRFDRFRSVRGLDRLQ